MKYFMIFWMNKLVCRITKDDFQIFKDQLLQTNKNNKEQRAKTQDSSRYKMLILWKVT